jgi:hypothetical protein
MAQPKKMLQCKNSTGAMRRLRMMRTAVKLMPAGSQGPHGLLNKGLCNDSLIAAAPYPTACRRGGNSVLRNFLVFSRPIYTASSTRPAIVMRRTVSTVTVWPGISIAYPVNGRSSHHPWHRLVSFFMAGSHLRMSPNPAFAASPSLHPPSARQRRRRFSPTCSAGPSPWPHRLGWSGFRQRPDHSK